MKWFFCIIMRWWINRSIKAVEEIQELMPDERENAWKILWVFYGMKVLGHLPSFGAGLGVGVGIGTIPRIVSWINTWDHHYFLVSNNIYVIAGIFFSLVSMAFFATLGFALLSFWTSKAEKRRLDEFHRLRKIRSNGSTLRIVLQTNAKIRNSMAPYVGTNLR
jgi:hypothetical protein